MCSKTLLRLLLLAGLVQVGGAQKLPEIPLDQNWRQIIAERAPKAPAAQPKQARKVLVFSQVTGFKHWCIPHTEAMIEILGRESGAYETVSSLDVEIFRPERLKEFDAVVLNNNCPAREKRDVFYDVIVKNRTETGKKYAAMPMQEREALVKHLYESLVDYVAGGGGLVLLHGGISNFNNSEEFSDLAGGSFDYHPPQQELSLKLVEPEHPLLKPFGGKPFVHIDEPYVLKGAYDQFNFRPLLELDKSTIKINSEQRMKEFVALPRYVAWIKPHEQGRVFFCSPSHNAQSFERPELLAFILNGMQYVIGDLEGDDQPLGKQASSIPLPKMSCCSE